MTIRNIFHHPFNNQGVSPVRIKFVIIAISLFILIWFELLPIVYCAGTEDPNLVLEARNYINSLSTPQTSMHHIQIGYYSLLAGFGAFTAFKSSRAAAFVGTSFGATAMGYYTLSSNAFRLPFKPNRNIDSLDLAGVPKVKSNSSIADQLKLYDVSSQQQTVDYWQYTPVLDSVLVLLFITILAIISYCISIFFNAKQDNIKNAVYFSPIISFAVKYLLLWSNFSQKVYLLVATFNIINSFILLICLLHTSPEHFIHHDSIIVSIIGLVASLFVLLPPLFFQLYSYLKLSKFNWANYCKTLSTTDNLIFGFLCILILLSALTSLYPLSSFVNNAMMLNSAT